MTVGRTLVAIPAWNEEGSIAGVIAKVREHRPEADILVVSDGSTDATAQLARAAGAVVVVLPFNVGVGGAMRTAFLHAAIAARTLAVTTRPPCSLVRRPGGR